MKPRAQEGRTLLDVLLALAGSSLLLVFGAANLLPGARTRSVDAAARRLAGQLRTLALRAVAEGRDAGLLFPPAGADEPLLEAADGDGDGLSRADVGAGRDPAARRFTLAAESPGARIGRPPWPEMSGPPPGGGPLAPDDPAVRFGRARMVVFGPEGHATPGSVFVTDGAQNVCAVVVAGPTARIRTWCYDRPTDSWRRR